MRLEEKRANVVNQNNIFCTTLEIITGFVSETLLTEDFFNNY